MDIKLEDWKKKTLYLFILKIKTPIIHYFVEEFSRIFFENIENILDGISDINSLFSEEQTSKMAILEIIKKFSRDNVYSHHSVERIELAGDKVLKGLLDIYQPLIDMPEESFKVLVNYKLDKTDYDKIKEENLHYEVRLLNTIPRSYVVKYQKALDDFNLSSTCNNSELFSEFNIRCHIFVDYLSGMTDDFALEQYKFLNGYLI